ncbi:hypothetical protein HG536_0A06240 [Torulaspora globosa]|uniref:Uncharacterized protein n=1 Tax=Torulaspora globosa TaxID=48254 RepID=A0A7G3ZBC3_9SACH|nr:uncharacterized protein HG536_0A06240 [Torulaspora globosa]QLL30809.1 hypothetical protein HG536_0A06240 [Torulaspora globosa]
MQRKRFRVLKDGEKPLQTKTTNVRTALPDPVVERPASKKISVSSRKRKAASGQGPDKRKKRSPSTLFDSEDVRIKVMDPSNDLKKINGARCTESELEERSPPGRLSSVEEEENSLQIEDFDQPPQSTSTPVLQPANRYREEGNSSLFLVNQPGFISPVLYQPNAYVYPGGSPQGSPFISRPFVEQNGYPIPLFAGDFQYTPSQPPPVARLPDDSHLYGYDPHRGSMSKQGPRYQTTYPMDNIGYQPYRLHCYSRSTRPVLYRDTVFPGSSNTGSYKSSGGEATYPDSSQSLKRSGRGGSEAFS